MIYSDTNLSNEEWLNLNRNSLSPEVAERFESVLGEVLEVSEDFESSCKQYESKIGFTEDTIDELSETIERLEQ